MHSTEIYASLQLDRLPYNMGVPIQLDTFDRVGVPELAIAIDAVVTDINPIAFE